MSSIEYAYNRFVTHRFPLPDEGQIDDLEARLGISLPADYRQFLLQFNGGFLDSYPEIVNDEPEAQGALLCCLHGIGSGQEVSELASPSIIATFFDEGEPIAFVPIGHTPMGSFMVLFLIAEERGTVWFKKAFGDYHFWADDLEEFFGLLKERPEV